jgi:hypothetical protein
VADPYAARWRKILWVANTSLPLLAIFLGGLFFINKRVGGWLYWVVAVGWAGSYWLLTHYLNRVRCPHCGGRFFKRNGPHRASGSRHCTHCGIRIGTAKADAPG